MSYLKGRSFRDRLQNLFSSFELIEEINYPQLIFQMIRIVQMARLSPNQEDYSGCVMFFYEMVPESWKDEQFKTDMVRAHKAIVESKGVAYVSDGGIHRPFRPPASHLRYMDYEEVEDVEVFTEWNYDEVFHACINLFDRRGLLMRPKRKQII